MCVRSRIVLLRLTSTLTPAHLTPLSSPLEPIHIHTPQLASVFGQQPSAAAGMSIDRLHKEMLQLIMHGCNLRDWLHLARCSRFTLQAASLPFAVRYLTVKVRTRFEPRQPRPSMWESIKRALSRTPTVPWMLMLLQRTPLCTIVRRQ